MFDATIYAQRRRRLLEKMGSGIAVIPTAAEKLRNRDAQYPYRADSYFYYLTGFPEPESVLVLIAGNKPQSILFCRARDASKEVWDGYRCGPQQAVKRYGVDAAYAITQFPAKFAELLADQPALWYSLGQDADWDTQIVRALNAVRTQSRAGKRAPAVIHDVRVALDEQRLIKDAREIDLMRRAAVITARAHECAMRRMGALHAGGQPVHEYELEAELLREFRRQGCQFPAYTSIVAAGANACVLHYVDNCQQIAPDDLVLIDAGGEFAGYAADITRCFPANGRFSAAQKEVYELVLAAQNAAIAAIRPKAGFMAGHEAALRVLVQGMIDLKLLQGSVDGLLEIHAYRRFFMHRTSHWLGLDVHDAGDYRQGDAWRTLTTGMVLTVEPGLYLRPAADVPQRLWNIGVRIEDDVLVTAAGCEVLTIAAPKSVAEIEATMSTR